MPTINTEAVLNAISTWALVVAALVHIVIDCNALGRRFGRLVEPLAATALGIEDLDLGDAADRLFQLAAQPRCVDHHVLRRHLAVFFRCSRSAMNASGARTSATTVICHDSAIR